MHERQIRIKNFMILLYNINYNKIMGHNNLFINKKN